jgi:hypothetical protein
MCAALAVECEVQISGVSYAAPCRREFPDGRIETMFEPTGSRYRWRSTDWYVSMACCPRADAQRPLQRGMALVSRQTSMSREAEHASNPSWTVDRVDLDCGCLPIARSIDRGGRGYPGRASRSAFSIPRSVGRSRESCPQPRIDKTVTRWINFRSSAQC